MGVSEPGNPSENEGQAVCAPTFCLWHRSQSGDRQELTDWGFIVFFRKKFMGRQIVDSELPNAAILADLLKCGIFHSLVPQGDGAVSSLSAFFCIAVLNTSVLT